MTTATNAPRLFETFRDTVLPEFSKKHGITNPMAAPKLVKIVVSMGVGEAKENKTVLDSAVADMTLITGQKAAVTRARMSVSNFKLREDMPIGCRVTLRGPRMWEFLDRLISIVIPRIKDFRGLKAKLDGRGNYSLGLNDQTVFPEIDLDRIKHYQGMNITIVTSAGSDDKGRELLSALGMPFRRPKKADGQS
ncbi:MAG: 50S ribosomal protein L5 [Planctomycetota bacterium]|nr:MAG: 50S ribosomal protein L5 [Planctomycetota bacterium]